MAGYSKEFLVDAYLSRYTAVVGVQLGLNCKSKKLILKILWLRDIIIT